MKPSPTPFKQIVEYRSPKGKIFYDAYGPMVSDRALATRFANHEAAAGAAHQRLGHGTAFWNCEIQQQLKARQEYEGWSFRIFPDRAPLPLKTEH